MLRRIGPVIKSVKYVLTPEAGRESMVGKMCVYHTIGLYVPCYICILAGFIKVHLKVIIFSCQSPPKRRVQPNGLHGYVFAT